MKVFIIGIFLTVGSVAIAAETLSYRNSSEVGPHAYLFRENGIRKDPVFDEYRSVDLGFDLGIGSDCGRVDFKSTLRATLKNLLNTEYFGDMGKDILAGSPMLLTCYFSPTWCSILKHTQIKANFLSQMRLDQCSIMDKYVDSRTEVFYQERQKCVHQEVARNGGNLEDAMKKCENQSVTQMNLTNWAGDRYGNEVNKNELLGSSAKWAGFTDRKSSDTLNLIKAFVGDSVVSKGQVSVSYGPKKVGLTPRTYLRSIERGTYKALCSDVLAKIDNRRGTQAIEDIVTDADLAKVNAGSELPYIDRQTIHYLSYLPYKERSIYCRKLSSSVSMASFSEEMNRSLDMMTVLLQNPNLPESEKQQLDRKRRVLKEQISLTLDLQRERNAPLNQVVAQINQAGRDYQGRATGAVMDLDADRANFERSEAGLMDCSDKIFCDEQ